MSPKRQGSDKLHVYINVKLRHVLLETGVVKLHNIASAAHLTFWFETLFAATYLYHLNSIHLHWNGIENHTDVM